LNSLAIIFGHCIHACVLTRVSYKLATYEPAWVEYHEMFVQLISTAADGTTLVLHSM